uniref:Secreted protein n=1 Tax=Loa loa TaxID=7209 RepID=A0A1I7VY93_LOALO
MSQKGRLAAGPVLLLAAYCPTVSPVDILRRVTVMSSAADDGADEVKVFRRNDADDVETAQSSHQLTEDKKDVALETELETRTPSSSIIGSKPGAFVKPSPTFPTFSAATLSPTYGPLPLFYPFFLPLKVKERYWYNIALRLSQTSLIFSLKGLRRLCIFRKMQIVP